MREVKYEVKLKLPAKKAIPAPPVSTILGPSNINLIKFCDDFNNWSKNLQGEIEFGVLIYDDLSYDILSIEQFIKYKSAQFTETFSFLYSNQQKKSIKK